jgi:hypothetical protein
MAISLIDRATLCFFTALIVIVVEFGCGRPSWAGSPPLIIDDPETPGAYG